MPSGRKNKELRSSSSSNTPVAGTYVKRERPPEIPSMFDKSLVCTLNKYCMGNCTLGRTRETHSPMAAGAMGGSAGIGRRPVSAGSFGDGGQPAMHQVPFATHGAGAEGQRRSILSSPASVHRQHLQQAAASGSPKMFHLSKTLVQQGNPVSGVSAQDQGKYTPLTDGEGDRRRWERQ